jgi:hypothetical protein
MRFSKRATRDLRFVQVHKKLKLWTCTWAGCDKAHGANQVCNQNMDSQDKKIKSTCTWLGCKKKLSLQRGFVKHIQGRHKNLRPFKCGCSKAYAYKSILVKHLKKFPKHSAVADNEDNETENDAAWVDDELDNDLDEDVEEDGSESLGDLDEDLNELDDN